MNTEPVVEESPFKGQTGIRRIWNAFNYSLSGLHAAYVNEDAFRQESLLAALLIPVALVLPVSGMGKAVMIGSVLLVLIVELLNSAIEAAIDRISLDRPQAVQAGQGHRQRRGADRPDQCAGHLVAGAAPLSPP
jgi:diacylglycerol kinase (ATP)